MTHGYLHQHGLSLLGGWLPWTIQLVVVVLILLAIGRRPWRWLAVWLTTSVLAGLLAMFGAMAYVTNAGVLTDPAPLALWVWITVTVALLVMLVAGWSGSRWWRRALSVLTVPLSLVCVGIVLNQWVGYFPTAQAAWGELTSGPLPGEVSQQDLPALQGKGATMTTGRVVSVTIPDTASHFAHRQEYVYLPPAWFTGTQHPELPAIMMIGGEFNTPADWIRTGNALSTADHYAQTHHGYAPMLVFVDVGGTFNNDTECVNGPRGNVADHLTEDVRPYVTSQFGASVSPAKWGIVGWSMGGTCATDLTLMHPGLFSTFESIAGGIAPASGDKQQTIDRLFGGNAAAYASFDPLTILAHQPHYTDTAALFEVSNGAGQGRGPNGGGRRRPGWGGNDNDLAAAQQICAAGTKNGIQCSVQTKPEGHTWQFASQAFADALPWMDSRFQRDPATPAPPAP